VKTAVAEPVLVRQAHGGALLSGGTPGQQGGTGAPPSALRRRLQGSLADRVRILEEIADDAEVCERDRIRAIEVLARYGLGAATELTVENVRERLSRTLDILHRELDPYAARRIVSLIQPVWS
jgi:hypothetical protein